MEQHKMNLLSSSTFAAFILGATLLGGCVVNQPGTPPGESSGGSQNQTSGGGGESGAEYFANNVFPKLSVCAGCHATGNAGAPIFLANDGKSSYEKVKTRPELYTAQSGILLRGAHTGPALNADQKTVVKKWLDLEFGGTNNSSGGATTGDPTPTPTGGALSMGALIQEFRLCMDPDVWKDAGMDAWSVLQTEGFGPCAGCHQQGNAGTFINDDPDVTFEGSKAEPYIYRYVIAHYSDGGKLDGLERSDRLVDKGNSVIGFDPKDVTYRHPTYIVPQNLVTALHSFQDTTLNSMDNLRTNTCKDPH